MRNGTWSQVATQAEADELVEIFGGFHDSILRESKFCLGAFINPNLALVVGNKPYLRCIFQRQNLAPTVIEVVFSNVGYFQIKPDCENAIDEASVVVKEDSVVWHEGPSSIEAESMFWRTMDAWVGKRERYSAVTPEDLSYYDPEPANSITETRGPGAKL